MSIFKEISTPEDFEESSNRIFNPELYTVKFEGKSFKFADVEEIEFMITKDRVIIEIDADIFINLKIIPGKLEEMGITKFLKATSEELDNLPGSYTYEVFPMSDYVRVFITANEGFDEVINLDVEFRRILKLLARICKKRG